MGLTPLFGLDPLFSDSVSWWGLGVSTRPLADLRSPLAPGRGRGTGSEVSSPLGAREPKGLRRRLRPLRPGFRVCSTTALALQAPGEPGSLSISRNWSGVKLHLSSCHIACKMTGKMKYCIRRASILFGLQLYLNRMMESV